MIHGDITPFSGTEWKVKFHRDLIQKVTTSFFKLASWQPFSEPGTIQTPKLSKYVQPSRKRPHRDFQNPEVLPSKHQRNPAVPKFVSAPPELYHGPQTFTIHLNWNPRPAASVRTSYSQSSHLAIDFDWQFWNLTSNLKSASVGFLENISPPWNGRKNCQIQH